MMGGMRAPFGLAGLVLCGSLVMASGAQQTPGTHIVRATHGHDGGLASISSHAGNAEHEVYADVRGRFVDVAAMAHGSAWLVATVRLPGPFADGSALRQLEIRIPLASTEEAYGESRSCKVLRDGSLAAVLTAGLDEPNFVPFATSLSAHDFHFLLNKYLCRALAAPVRCGNREYTLPQNIQFSRIDQLEVQLHSDAPAAFEISFDRRPTDVLFDYKQCEKIAPSGGLCCVAGKTTEWHCGQKPQGEGWHQVSGSCFHRETGGSCKG